jgi:hypothetical protein
VKESYPLRIVGSFKPETRDLDEGSSRRISFEKLTASTRKVKKKWDGENGGRAGGKRSEVDVLSLLWLGISNAHGSSSSAHQLAEKGEESPEKIFSGAGNNLRLNPAKQRPEAASDHP